MTTKTHLESQVNPSHNHVSESALSVPTMCVFCRRVMDEPCRSEMDAKGCILFREANEGSGASNLGGIETSRSGDACSPVSGAEGRHPTTRKSPAIPPNAGRTGDGGESGSSTPRPLEPLDIPPNERPPRGLCASSLDPEFCYPGGPSVEATQQATGDAARFVDARCFAQFPRKSALPVIPGSDCPGRIIHPRNERHAAELEAEQEQIYQQTQDSNRTASRQYRPRRVQGKRTYQRSPDRQASICRRQMYANMGIIPDADARRPGMTQAVRALATVVALETKANGICSEFIDKMCAIAGVCRSTWQRMKAACGDLFHVLERRLKGARSATNVVTIKSKALQRRVARTPPIGLQNSSPTTSKSLTLEAENNAKTCGQLRLALEMFGKAVAFNAIPYLQRQTEKMIEALAAPS